MESLTPSSRRVIQRARDRRARLGPDEDGEGEEIVELGFQLEVAGLTVIYYYINS